MAFNYGTLNLDGVQPQRENNSLLPGRHVCRVANPELKTVAGGATQLAIELVAVDGSGKTADRITVHHPRANNDPKAKKAVEIGMERLKAVLVYGGHPNPDQHHDIRELRGLVVGVVCERDEDWTDDNGVKRQGGVKPRRNGAYFRPENAPAPMARPSEDEKWGGQPPAGGPNDLDDEIPF